MGGKLSAMLKKKNQHNGNGHTETRPTEQRDHPYDEIDEHVFEANRRGLAASNGGAHSGNSLQNEVTSTDHLVYENSVVRHEEVEDIADLYTVVNKPKRKPPEPSSLNYVQVEIVSSSHNAPRRPEVKREEESSSCTYSEIIPSNGKFLVKPD